MRREILALLLFSVLINAALDQSYTHTVSSDGSSTITKSMDLTIFSNILGDDAFERIDEICQANQTADCSVDKEERAITITERFSEGSYYTLTVDHGIPYVTYNLVVRRVSTDRFASSLDRLLVAAEAVEEAGGATESLNLRDEANKESADYLERFKANITYTINMPAPVHEARAGTVNGSITGNSVQFDFIDVLRESDYMVVTSKEINYGYLSIIAMVIVLAALAVSFFRGKKPSKKSKKRKR
jgi:hypothetical protein